MTDDEMGDLILLKNKVSELVSAYSTLKDELIRERSEKELLQTELEEERAGYKSLKKEIEQMKLSGAILGDGNNSLDARKRINELVREIDNCIALLNNI